MPDPSEVSEALKFADNLRNTLTPEDAAAKVHELFNVAQRESAHLLERLGRVTRLSGQSPNGVAPILRMHLNTDDMTRAIYRHAMVHAGALVNPEDDRIWEFCPQCATRLRERD